MLSQTASGFPKVPICVSLVGGAYTDSRSCRRTHSASRRDLERVDADPDRPHLPVHHGWMETSGSRVGGQEPEDADADVPDGRRPGQEIDDMPMPLVVPPGGEDDAAMIIGRRRQPFTCPGLADVRVHAATDHSDRHDREAGQTRMKFHPYRRGHWRRSVPERAYRRLPARTAGVPTGICHRLSGQSYCMVIHDLLNRRRTTLPRIGLAALSCHGSVSYVRDQRGHAPFVDKVADAHAVMRRACA